MRPGTCGIGTSCSKCSFETLDHASVRQKLVPPRDHTDRHLKQTDSGTGTPQDYVKMRSIALNASNMSNAGIFLRQRPTVEFGYERRYFMQAASVVSKIVTY